MIWVSLLYIFVKLNIKAKNLVLGAKKKQRHEKKMFVNVTLFWTGLG